LLRPDFIFASLTGQGQCEGRARLGRRWRTRPRPPAPWPEWYYGMR